MRRTRASRPRRQRAVRAQAERRVDRLRAFVKEIERPDVDRCRPRDRSASAPTSRCAPAHYNGRRMSLRELRRHAGRLAIVGFRRPHGPGRSPPPRRGVRSRRRHLLRPQHRPSPSRSPSSRASAPRSRATWPFWISVDQEGGRVARLKRRSPNGRRRSTLGRSGDDGAGRRDSRRRSPTELRAVGINLDYAPVLDVHTNPANPVIGDRALSERPDVVARLGGAVITATAGRRRRGVRQALSRPRRHQHRLARRAAGRRARPPAAGSRRVRAVPAAIAAGVATIMTAHVLVPALDKDRIASFSPLVVEAVLKGALGFGGRGHQRRPRHEGGERDDALAGRDAWPRSPPAATPCCCATRRPDEQVRGDRGPHPCRRVRRAVEKRIDDALERQRRIKERFLSGARAAVPLDVIGCDAHQSVADEMARGSDATHCGGLLKFRPVRRGSRVALVAPASPLRPRGVRRRRGRAPAARPRTCLGRRRVRSRADDGRPSAASRAASLLRALDEMRRRRRDRRARRLRQRRDAAAARRRPHRADRAPRFVGYSDVTSLHAYLDCRGRPGVGARRDDRRPARGRARRPTIRRRSCEPAADAARGAGAGRARNADLRPRDEPPAPLVGGTLTQLLASLGTPYEFQPPDGHVLFLDEVNERPYRLHRMLTQLRLSGRLERGGGRVRPDAGLRRAGRQLTARDVIAGCALQDFPGPVLFGLPVGPHRHAARRACRSASRRASSAIRRRRGSSSKSSGGGMSGARSTSSASAAPRWRRWRRCSRRAGIDVQGSDHGVYPPMSDFLAREGIRVFDGYRAEHITPRHRTRRRRQRDLARQSRARGSARPEDPLHVAAGGDPRRVPLERRGRSSSPARTARRRRRRWRAGC